jgi:hypothetical protein
MDLTPAQRAQRRLDRRMMSPTQRARWRARRQAQLRQIAEHYRRTRARAADPRTPLASSECVRTQDAADNNLTGGI